MGLCLKTTAGLLLLVQAFHLASLQDSTDSPGRTIDKSYLRGNPNTAEEMEPHPGSNGTELNSGIASGSMAVDEEDANKTSDSVTAVATAVAPTLPTNVTTNQTGLPDATTSTNTSTTGSTNSSQINITETAREFHNSTTTTTATSSTSTSHLSAQNSTSFPDNSNHTELQTTTMAPGSNATQEFTTKHTGSTNATESANTTTSTATTRQQINETSAVPSSTTVSSSGTTQTSPAATTTAAPITPEMANNTDKDAASGSSSERGLAADNHKNKRHGAWGAVLGTAVAVVFVGAVAYIILKKKHQKGFSHSKLVEDFPSDPVLRLDNGAPLDLNFGLGGSAYYNPGIQRDELQMTSFPGHH